MRRRAAARRAGAGRVRPLLVGLDDGDDAAVVAAPDGGPAFVLTTDFFTPVVDDAYDWGRIAATNALSDIYAMGGRPVVAVNLLCWPREVLPMELAAEVLRGGLAVTSAGRLPPRRRAQRRRPGAQVRPRRHRRRRPGPDAAQRRRPGRATAVADQEARHRGAQLAAQGDRRGLRPRRRRDDHAQPGRRRPPPSTADTAAPPMSPASGCSATCSSSPAPAASPRSIDSAAVEYLDGAREAAAAGYVSGGTRRNLDWVRPDTRFDGRRRDRGAAAGRRADLRRPARRRRDPGRPGHRRARPARRASRRRASDTMVGSSPEVFVGWCRPRPSKP